MGIIQRLMDAVRGESRASIENPSVPISKATVSDIWGDEAAGPTKAGAGVGYISALKQTAVWACIRVLSETVAALPLAVYRRDGENSEVYRDHPWYPVLHESPNEMLTSFSFFEALMVQANLWSNAYALIMRREAGGALLLLMPSMVRYRVTDRGLRYWVTGPDGETEYGAEDIIHIRGMSLDGICGLSPILEAGREAIGLALAAEEYTSRFFSNGAHVKGVLTTDQVLSEDAVKRLRQQWAAMQSGLTNAHKSAVLEQGLKWQAISQSAKDSQLQELRQQQTEEICRVFRVPPMFVGDYSRMTYANAEHNDLHFTKHCITPWLRRIEQELNRKLFSDEPDVYCEFKLDGLLRGDFQTRITSIVQGIQGAVYTPNEGRKLMNLPPMEGGDTLFLQQNMASAKAIEEGQQPAEQSPEQPSGDDDEES